MAYCILRCVRWRCNVQSFDVVEGDRSARIIAYVCEHPGCTAHECADGIMDVYSRVQHLMRRMSKRGELIVRYNGRKMTYFTKIPTSNMVVGGRGMK